MKGYPPRTFRIISTSRGGAVANPKPDPSKPMMQFPPGRERIYEMSDEEVLRRLSETTPPVTVTRQAQSS